MNNIFHDVEWIKTDYVIALFGSELDEDDMPYVNVYEWELKEFLDDLASDIEYVKKLNWSLSERYNYYRALLIQSSKGLLRDVRDVDMNAMDKLAFRLAEKVC